jgi:thiol-disulfide isomerase/thioredoxin
MELQHILNEASNKAISYKQYRDLVQAHANKRTNSGRAFSELLATYTVFNDQLMERLDNTLKISPENQRFLSNFKKEVYFLIITESWCGDAAQTMPMMNQVARASGVDFKVVLRDQNLELIDSFLTNGGRSIAKLILVDANTNLPMATWGPRPTKATQLVADEKAAKGLLSTEFKQELQNWYNKDKGKDTENDLVEMLRAI